MIKAKDINSQRFEKAAFGYKQEDVDTFLSEIAADYAQLMRENEDINAKLQVLADKVREYRKDEEAVKDAYANARNNRIKNIHFVKADAGQHMKKMAMQKQHADVVFMDPPRAGSDAKFIDSVVRLNPGRIVYISCNPVTLKRDLEMFGKKGYKVKKIQPVDMFPGTEHVETVVLLSRVK